MNGDRVEIIFIDYGNTEEVPTSALVTLPPYLASLPMQAAHCTLWGVEPIEGGSNWGEDASDQFYELATGSSMLVMTVCGEGMYV